MKLLLAALKKGHNIYIYIYIYIFSAFYLSDHVAMIFLQFSWIFTTDLQLRGILTAGRKIID